MTAPRDTILVVDPAGLLACRMPAQGAVSAAWVWLSVEALPASDGPAGGPVPSVAFVARAPGDAGVWLETLGRLRGAREDLPVVVLDPEPDLDRALATLRSHGFDYRPATASSEELAEVARRALETCRLALARRRVLGELVELVGELARQSFQVDADVGGLRPRLQVAAELDSSPGEVLSALVAESDPQAAAELAELVRPRVAGDLRVVGSAAEALEACRRRPCGLVLVGATPDGDDLIGLVRRLREAAPEAILVIVVGFSQADVAVRALRIGAAAFLIRPLDPAEVSARLEDVFHQHQGRQRARRYLGAFRQRVQALVDQLAGSRV